MKSLLSALVLTAASVLPVSAGLHDFNPANTAHTRRAQAGEGQCVTTRDRSQFCYVRTSAMDFSIAIKDIDYPTAVGVVHMDCKTGRWLAYGDIPKDTISQYMAEFCPQFS